MTPQDIATSTNQVEEDLRQIRTLTRKMRKAQDQIATAGLERRRLFRRLRDRQISFRMLADAAGTTEQAVYKDLRWGRKESEA